MTLVCIWGVSEAKVNLLRPHVLLYWVQVETMRLSQIFNYNVIMIKFGPPMVMSFIHVMGTFVATQDVTFDPSTPSNDLGVVFVYCVRRGLINNLLCHIVHVAIIIRLKLKMQQKRFG